MDCKLNKRYIVYLQNVSVKREVNIGYKLKVGTHRDGLLNYRTLGCCSFLYPFLKSPFKFVE